MHDVRHYVTVKISGGNSRARVTLMLKKEFCYERKTDYEDDENPLLTILIKEKKGKNLALTAIYREWKAPGEVLPIFTRRILFRTTCLFT